MEAASCIIAVLQITGTVINLCYHYRKGVKSASKDIARITTELKTLMTVLEQLLQLAENDDRLKNAKGLCEPGGPLCDCRALMEELQKKLEPEDGFRAAIVRAAMWPLREAELEKTLVRIGSFKQTFSLALGGDQARMILKVDDGVTDLTKSFESERFARERDEIFEWLRAPDPSGSHNAKRKEHQPETGQWLLNSEQYADWKSSPNSFIWLHGIPGCGKSILFSTATQDIIDSCLSQKQHAIAYFYFCFSEQIKIKNDYLIRSLISQLLSQSPDVPEVAKMLFKRFSFGKQQPSTDDWKTLLPPMVRSFQKTYIMVDALDECTEWPELLQFIGELHHWGINSLHLLVTSRKEKEITDALDPLEPVQLSLQNHLLDPDIRLHVRRTIASDSKCKKWPCDIRTEVETTLVEKAKGMFRWVQCQLNELRKCITNSRVRAALHRLPQTLDETYDRILIGIDDEYKADVLKILQWLCYAYRPLRLRDVAEVLTVDLKSDPHVDFDRRPNDPFDLLHVCSCLVILESNRDNDISPDSIMRLAHFSVREYLVSERIQRQSAQEYSILPIPAHISIAETCLAYLLHLGQTDTSSAKIEREHPLDKYAAYYWTSHYRTLGTRENEPALLVDDLAFKLIKDRQCLGRWVEACDKYSSIRRAMGWSNHGAPEPLYFASYEGLYKTTNRLLDGGANVNNTGGRYGNALQAASLEGYRDVSDLLLQKGADVNQVGGSYGTALQAASAAGCRDVVDLLLQNNADVNQVGGEDGPALQAASSRGHRDVVYLLLQSNADVNQVGGSYGTALQAASFEGHRDVADLLLQKGADVNQVGGVSGTTLQAASYLGYQDVVDLLLQKGADVNQVGGQYGTALQAASWAGERDVVDLLLQKGAAVNQVGGQYGTALQAASNGRHRDVVDLLLQNGADVSQVSGEFGTALQASCTLTAFHKKKEEFVQKVFDRLLRKGATVNLVGGRHGTALQAAEHARYKTVVDLLLKNGIDINLVDGRYGTALQALCAQYEHWGNEKEEVVQRRVDLLLRKGAAVDLVGGQHGSVLHAAAHKGYKKVVELLLKNGANINLVSGKYGTALQAACAPTGYRRKEEDMVHKVVDLLIRNGATVDLVGGEYGNPLQAAAYEGYPKVVELLLKDGANINLVGGRYGTALQAAAYKGYKKVVELLLNNGANINLVSGKYGTALQAACAQFEYREKQDDVVVEVVDLLLQKGAATNLVGGEYGTALQAAVHGAYKMVVDLLLKNGARMKTDSWGGDYHTVLLAAVRDHRQRAINILLDSGPEARQTKSIPKYRRRNSTDDTKR